MTGDVGFDYDEKSAARILLVSTKTLKRYRASGRIGFYQLPGGRIRYTLDHLHEFQQSCRGATGGQLCPPVAA